AGDVGEYLLWLTAAIPLYAVAGWLSGAGAGGVVRSVCYLSTVAVGAWGLGTCVASGRRPLAGAAVMMALIGGVGLPVAHYLLIEVAGSAAASGWLRAAPCTFAFGLAAGAEAGPYWAWVLWPAIGALAALVTTIVSPSPENPRSPEAWSLQ
ncbi:hypothetical protein LCGC14_2585430, partial [marine sediment metagenome]